MTDPLFVAQEQLERWLGAGEATFEGNLLTLLAEQRSYRLAPGVSVRSLIDGDDRHGLVGRVVSIAELEALGAEHYAGSIILGDTGYECDEGFVGTEQSASGRAGSAAAAAASEPESDTALLVDFLLKHL